MGACVVGHLHVWLGHRIPAVRGPAPNLSILPDARSRPGGGWAGLAAGPACTAFHWTWVRISPPTAFLLGRACERRAPLGRADLGTKFKDLKVPAGAF